MKPNKSDIMKWINALRSGKYSQTIGTLQNKKGYCCLGVLTELTSPEYERNAGFLFGAFPYMSHGAPSWVEKIDNDFKKRCGVSLTDLNDGTGKFHVESSLVNNPLTFDEIADVLQAVYIEEVLE